MNNADYHAWLEANCPIGVEKNNFTAFLAIKTISFLEQSNSGGKIAYLVYEASDHYKNFYER